MSKTRRTKGEYAPVDLHPAVAIDYGALQGHIVGDLAAGDDAEVVDIAARSLEDEGLELDGGLVVFVLDVLEVVKGALEGVSPWGLFGSIALFLVLDATAVAARRAGRRAWLWWAAEAPAGGGGWLGGHVGGSEDRGLAGGGVCSWELCWRGCECGSGGGVL